MLEAEQAQQLGHLGNVAEHVGQVPHPHGATECVGRSQAELEVPDVGLARDEELVGQRVPRADGEATLRRQPGEPFALLGPDGEVVVEHGRLPVEQEVGECRVGLEPRQQIVEQLYEPRPEPLERCVPLPIPMRVRNDVHVASHVHWVAHRFVGGRRSCAPQMSQKRGFRSDRCALRPFCGAQLRSTRFGEPDGTEAEKIARLHDG